MKFNVTRYDERDVFMNRDHLYSLRDRMVSDKIPLPQIFIHGQLLGVSIKTRSFSHNLKANMNARMQLLSNI